MTTPKLFDKEWRTGDREKAKLLARAYVADNRERLASSLASLARGELVALVSEYRKAGKDTERIIVDMWLISEYEPQKITGKINIGTPPEGTE